MKFESAKKINLIITSIGIVISLSAVAALPSSASETALKSEEQKTFYAIGLAVSRTLSIFALTPAEFELVKQGLTDAVTGKKTEVELNAYNEKVQQLAKARRAALGEKQAVAGKEFLEKSAKEKGALKTDTGMIYFSLKEGSGENPKAKDTVNVNYRGTFVDGREFDSSYKRGKPVELRLDGVIKCWTEGLQKMKPGGKAKLVCPSSLAYGDTGAGELILPGVTLVFEVELLEIKK